MFRSYRNLVHLAAYLYFFFCTASSHTGIVNKPEDYELVVGSKATFHCTLNADHSLYLKINWLIEDKPIIDFTTDSRFVKTDNSLIITNVIASDSGTYTCLAISTKYNSTASYKLIVQDKPSPPQLLETTCHDKRAVIIWRSKENSVPPILNYLIEYNTSFAPHTWLVASKYIPPTAKTFAVPLTPWTNFTFRVTAINKIGRSNPSSLSNVCSTKPDVPYKNPERVIVSANEHSCYLVVRWTPMPLVEHNGPDFVYRVCWKKDFPLENWNCEVIADYTKNELAIYNRQKYQNYKIKVVASNKLGDSKGHQVEVIEFSGTYDKNNSGILYTLKWIFAMFVIIYFFFIILFVISSICLIFTSDKRSCNNEFMRTSSRRRNNHSLFRFLGQPHSFWVSSINAKKSEIEQNSAMGSEYSMTEIDKGLEVTNEEENNSFCDLMQTTIIE